MTPAFAGPGKVFVGTNHTNMKKDEQAQVLKDVVDAKELDDEKLNGVNYNAGVFLKLEL